MTYLLTFAVSGMAVWLGTVILSYTVNLPAVRLVGYAGPQSLMPLQAWGWWFVVSGLVGFTRPLFHEALRISLALHLFKMCALLAWALAFDFGGPPTTGQAAYTFLAVISFLTPWLPAMIEQRYGKRPDLPSDARRF